MAYRYRYSRLLCDRGRRRLMPRWKNERTRRRQCDVALHGLNLLAAVLLNEQRQREWSTTIMACNSAIQAADLTYALHLHSAARQATNCTLLLHMHACSCTGSCRRLCLCAESNPRIFCWAKEESHMQKREREKSPADEMHAENCNAYTRTAWLAEAKEQLDLLPLLHCPNVQDHTPKMKMVVLLSSS